ncbi:Filamentous hemagglutinin-like protein [Fimbriiglobus ruber]|uniref:Filamentous hemagglutinin-like protein n=1 Tax=Fimbriiglobus ruber TaxID=1908690 RepID=A0A225DEK8_9BACT|nr:Filamentous hemagglutinin-like protein [Fimbriiglobus ruber]
MVPLSTGNVVITAPDDSAGGTDAGAVYLFNGSTGALISTLVGSHADDKIGTAGVTVLTNGNYVVDSSSWSGNIGAVTFGSGTTGVSGVVSASNSLVGSTPGDFIGTGVMVLPNGNYVVDSSSWSNSAGAVTFGNGMTGVSGVVSASNSLVGSIANDFVGGEFGGSVVVLASGNYLVASPNWSGNEGAVTFGSGTAG